MTTPDENTNQDLEPKDDAFDMAPDVFRKAKAEMLTAEPGPKEDPAPEDKPDDKPKELDLKDFSLEPKPKDGDEEETEEIIHNGQARKLKKSELKVLAQKGFDYEHKVSQLQPHRNLINAITHDRNLAGIVDDYIRSGGRNYRAPEPPQAPKLPEGFKVKSLKEFSSDDPEAADKWLQENVTALSTAIRADMVKGNERPAAQPTGEVPGGGPGGNDPNTGNMVQLAQSVLFHRDPDEFNKIYPEMLKVIPKLTQEQFNTINAQAATGNMIGLTRLYDHVKSFLTQSGGNGDGIPQHGKKTFRMKPDGGKPSGKTQTNDDDPEYVWNKSPKDFQAEIRKAKGY